MTIPNESYTTVVHLQLRGAPPTFWNRPLTPDANALQLSLNDAAAEINSYISVKVPLPLTPPYDPRLIRANVDLAMWYIIGIRGYDPENPADVTFEIHKDDTLKWLQRVADGKAKLKNQQVMPSSMGGAQPQIASNAPRGIRNWHGSVGSGGWGF